MDNKYFSINVLIIMYKQEDLIGRALDSILCQREYGLNKIIISDDCSPDKSCEVVNAYVANYPDFIEIHQNDCNLGIYGNAEKLYSLKGDADLYYLMAGDDALCNGWFMAVQNFLRNKNIDIRSQAACIFSDWKISTPQGSEYVIRQKIIEKKEVNPISLRIRGLVSGRSMLQSRKVIDKQEPVDLEHGVSKAEKFFDFQPILHANNFYYCPSVGSIYYSGIGISTTSHSVEYRKGIIEANQSFLEEYSLRKKDERHIKYKIAFEEYHIEPSLKKYLKMMFYYVSSIDLKIRFSLREFIYIATNL